MQDVHMEKLREAKESGVSLDVEISVVLHAMANFGSPSKVDEIVECYRHRAWNVR